MYQLRYTARRILIGFHFLFGMNCYESGGGGGSETSVPVCSQGLHRPLKYLNIQDCLEKSLKIKFALKST